jgi:8-oxo-dGTP pyrophosphatase MutT (NUDIX family)
MLVRSAAGGLEILFLRRNPTLAFHGDYWVFPGGRIDPEDADPVAPDDEVAAARRAAVREAQEEAGVEVSPESLAFAVHWTTPAVSPIRFATWFFVAPASPDRVTVDGGEIHAHQWLRPADALARQRAGEIKLAAPTFALTTRLAGFADVDSAMAAVAGWTEERLLGRLIDVDNGVVALYHQDAAYADGRLDRDGPRHRLWMVRSGWRYERAF